MAMDVDVHISHDAEPSIEQATTSYPVTSEQNPCIDACGHCSHHQAHSFGLLLSNIFPDHNSQTILFPLLKTSLFLHTQAPPVRPPKA